MTQDTIERRDAVILVADVVGYSRLMGEDEAGTLLAMQEHRFALIDPTIGQYQGRIVKQMGDGILVEFQDALAAVRCATDIQHRMVDRNAGAAPGRQIRFRIGVHLGHILIDNDDIYGDDVNIAARLQEIAEPDGVAISLAVLSEVDGRIDQGFIDIGAHQFKNIIKAIRVYHYSPDPAVASSHTAFRPFVDLPAAETPLVTGGCLCGAVRYEAREKALGSMLCHCRMCQKFSGAPILGGTTFRTQALRFTSEQPKFYRSSQIAERGFCPNCGTSLIYRGVIGVWTEWIMVFTASLDEPEKYPPTYHLGIESTMPWLDIRDDLPRTMCADSPSLVAAYKAVGEPVP